ncbi:unnamed protein product, partial [Ranitomeya imitator]
ISVDAYVDSGAALSLMDWSFANRCGFSLEPLEVPIPLKGIDFTPLAMNKPQYWTQVTMRMTPVHQEVIRFLNVVRLHGIPENIVSDRGSQFVSRFWRTFCAKMGIDLSFSSAFHPQTNGQTERTNQTLETYLRCFVSADQDDWVTFLPLAEFALNNRASSATLVSPFFCNSGFHPHFSSGQVEPSDCPGVDMVVDRLHQIWSHVVDNLKLSQERAQQFANRRRRVGPRLRVGDLVWLSSHFVPMKVSSPKFKPRFIGPYRILEILNPVSFRLDLPASFAIHNVFHRSLLRRYETLCRWILSVKKNYRKNVAYHNWRHAFNTAQCMFAALRTGKIQNKLNDLEILSLMIATLSHDLDHRGVNNSFIQRSEHPLAQLYCHSIMENHHFDQCLMILNSQGNQILSGLSVQDYKSALKMIKQAILATDLALYIKAETDCHISRAKIASHCTDWHGTSPDLSKTVWYISMQLSGPGYRLEGLRPRLEEYISAPLTIIEPWIHLEKARIGNCRLHSSMEMFGEPML